MDKRLLRQDTLPEELDKVMLDVLLPNLLASLNEMVREGVWVYFGSAKVQVSYKLMHMETVTTCLGMKICSTQCRWFRGPYPFPIGLAVSIPWCV